MRRLEFRRWLGIAIATLLPLTGIARADEAGGPGLRKAQEQYESSRMLKVDAPFEVELDKLNRQLDKALAGAEEAAIESGNLDLVTAYQSERKTLADSGMVPDLDDGIPAKIKQFRS
ncbi:MAG: hypothetical protein ACR2RV_04270, partial [Verrucomicrobiales bacterium]